MVLEEVAGHGRRADSRRPPAADQRLTATACRRGPHNDAVDIFALIAPLGTGVFLGVLGDRLALRREYDRDRLARSRDAAQALLPPLRRLRDLARDSQHDEHHPRAWSEGITEFARCYDDVGHRAPEGRVTCGTSSVLL